MAWTRLAVISLTTDAPDTQASVGRLLKNQTDIGNAIKPFYGAAAGKQLTALLREHILIAADLIAVAKKGDGAASREQARWTANADQIATLPLERQPALLEARCDEGHDARAPSPDDGRGRRPSAGQLGGRRPGLRPDPRQILHMSDMLSDGLVAQFPTRFRYRLAAPAHPPRGDRCRPGATRAR